MTALPLQPLQGMSDLATPEVEIWQGVEAAARRIFALYDVTEVRTPILELTRLFTRSLGETTDVVQKEMYSFEDRGGRQISLRPEGTAGVIRHLAGLGEEAAQARCYYLGPMFRSERPQAGRKRQFHQLGVELLGAPHPAADAEAVALQHHLLSAWGLNGARIEINTRGLPDDQRAVAEGLRKALQPHEGRLCEDCRRRMQSNILRVLDCKEPECGKVVEALPPVTSFMGDEARRYFEEVGRLLAALDIPFTVNPRLVRGLDYYVHTIWEVRHPALGAQDALSGGGRYRIVMDDGAKPIEGVGFAAGLERVVASVRNDQPEYRGTAHPLTAWIVTPGEAMLEQNMRLAQTLRRHGIACDLSLEPRSVKAQMRAAHRRGARYAVIRGEAELAQGLVVLKNMKDGVQEELEMAALLEQLILAAREAPAH